MAVGHYENFPVASILLPARLRHPIATIYRFARTADDWADEGDHPPAVRLAALARMSADLDRIEHGTPATDPAMHALAAVIAEHRLPIPLFRDLLDAFAQDVVKSRYASFDEVLDYARRSANPIGRLLLHLFGRTESEALARSDDICTALQLVNFWQDVAIDLAKDRVYLPQDDLARFGVREADLAGPVAGPAFRALLEFEIARTRAMLHRGACLGRMLRGRAGLEIRMIVAGGDTILEKLLACGCDIYRQRPVLRMPDWLSMLGRALFSDGRIAA